MPMPRPWLRVSCCSTAVDTTWVATRPKPSADSPQNAMTNHSLLSLRGMSAQPAASARRPMTRELRDPCRSTSRPASGARMAMTIRATATPPEMKLRDQPSSPSQIGIIRPTAARAEKASARATKPRRITSIGCRDFCATALDIERTDSPSPERAIPRRCQVQLSAAVTQPICNLGDLERMSRAIRKFAYYANIVYYTYMCWDWERLNCHSPQEDRVDFAKIKSLENSFDVPMLYGPHACKTTFKPTRLWAVQTASRSSRR